MLTPLPKGPEEQGPFINRASTRLYVHPEGTLQAQTMYPLPHWLEVVTCWCCAAGVGAALAGLAMSIPRAPAAPLTTMAAWRNRDLIVTASSVIGVT
ncbi:hypothetical protein GCM10028832_22210 [Streptomyces sparsus]